MAFHISFQKSLLFFPLLFPICACIDTITSSQIIQDGETLVSAAGNFEFGFFTPGKSVYRYVGIWYKKAPEDKQYAWVANREDPLANTSGAVSIGDDGNLAISMEGRVVFRITNASASGNSTSITLLDSGNLVLKDGRGNWIWQSVDYPTNTMLPGMKLGLNRSTGHNRVITSWKSEDDPSIGDLELRLDTNGSPQLFLSKREATMWRSGPWNGLGFSGVPQMIHQSVVNFHFTDDSNGIYYSYDMNTDSVLSRLILDSSGNLQREVWTEGATRWTLFWQVPDDQCNIYAKCGTYSSCDVNRVLLCNCLPGFKPKRLAEWNSRDWSGGCRPRRNVTCGEGDGFLKMVHVKLPDTSAARVVPLSSLRECREECLKNCSCSAYAGTDLEKWDKCLFWYGEFTDLLQYAEGGMDFYVRVPASELDSSWKRKRLVLILVFTIIPLTLLFLICGYCLQKRRYTEKGTGSAAWQINDSERGEAKSELLEDDEKSSGMRLFDLSEVMLATNNFSDSNKLGAGGFGPVYKGELKNGLQIAVKRLGSNSGQGTEEFKNEVKLIQQLQHRNMVLILGCCIEGEERMLIYEYMENKSLDFLIFDDRGRVVLDWPKRFNIIIGIARGVLYLHHDSRLRIIHRDLKASNILLDEEMNPKISDFGMARIFGGNQTQDNTKRVVGTYGYMSPEYALRGQFSVKSDVFSFGVLLLEIVSGERNSTYLHDGQLIGHAWDLWTEGRSLELVDSTIADSCSTGEVLRCIHVGLLCVQEYPINRPTMLTVVSMLGNETAMPPPKKPAFSSQMNFYDPESSTSEAASRTPNELTVTELEPR